MVLSLGLVLACTIGKADAQDALWVQNANFALKAQVQVSDGVVKSYAINSKTLIQYLKGATNVGLRSVSETVTNATIVVTNDVRFPAGTNVGADFVLTNYPVVINGVTYTDTDPLSFHPLPGEPVTYTFPNSVDVGTNITGFDTNATGLIFATGGFENATDITAIQGTGGTNETVFTVFGTSTNSSEQQVTNIVPAQFASKSQRLIVKSSLPDTETFFFFIRDGTPKSFVDYDVTTFFHYAQLAKVSQTKGSASTDYLDLSIDLIGDLAGTGFQTEANGKQVRGKVNGSDGIFVRSLSATCVGSGTAGTPIVTPLKPVPEGPMVLSGKFTVNGGKLEQNNQ